MRLPTLRLPTWSRTLLAAAIGACLLGGCAAVPSAPVDRADTAAVADWVAATAIPLREIEPDAALDDLAPVARSFADAQIVGLGESSHGVAEQLTVKHRVLRLLVEQLGFRSIAWEDDWTTGQMIDAYIVSGTGDLAAVMRRMSPQWQFNEVADVLRWLRAFNSGRRDKVRFVGVEYYLTRTSAYDAVDAYVARTAPDQLRRLRGDLQPLRPDTPDMFAFVQRVMTAADKLARLDAARRASALVAQIPHEPTDPDHALAQHDAAQIVSFYEHYNLTDADALVYRDVRAAQNLRWWLDRTGDKIVYWAATPHTANAARLRIGGSPGPDLRFPSTGSYLRSWYGPRYRSIGVAVGHGAACLGPGQTAALADPAADRFERPLLDSGVDQFLLDLHTPAPPAVRYWLSASTVYRGLADGGPTGFLDGGPPAQWFDMIVYRENATPAVPT